MLLLAIDTSLPSGSFSVLRNGKPIGVTGTWTTEDYSSRMFRQVQRLLDELSLDLAAFDAFAVTSGPGSFTGLRVGLAAAKGWAEAYCKPIVGVSALEAIAAQSKAITSLLVPVFDARRGEVYFGVYRRSQSLGPALVTDSGAAVSPITTFLSEIRAKIPDLPFTLVSPSPDVFVGEIDKATEFADRISVDSVSGFLAPAVGVLGWHRLCAGEGSNPLMIDADYVRRTDAEMKWKDRAI